MDADLALKLRRWKVELQVLNELINDVKQIPLHQMRLNSIFNEIIEAYKSLDDEPSRQAIRVMIRSLRKVHYAFYVPIASIATSADEPLLVKALVMHSIQGMFPDSRDVLMSVRSLREAAIKAGIDAQPLFDWAASISSDVDEQGMGSMRLALQKDLW